MEIMKLIPTGKDYLWGGIRLREEYGKQIDLTPLAETWECSVHPDGPSYVANGVYKGQTLAEVLSAHPEYLGTKVENGELPVLVKFIDARGGKRKNTTSFNIRLCVAWLLYNTVVYKIFLFTNRLCNDLILCTYFLQEK